MFTARARVRTPYIWYVQHMNTYSWLVFNDTFSTTWLYRANENTHATSDNKLETTYTLSAIKNVTFACRITLANVDQS